MPFNIIERGADDTSRKLAYELLLVVYSKFRSITHRFRDTSCFNAIKTTFLPTHLYLTGHAVGMWRRNLSPEN